MRPDNPMRNFDPRQLAYYEKENYVAYYEKAWVKLLRISVTMVKEAFALSWWQAAYAAYLVARAEIAFAPFPENDVPRAEAYMRRFYRFIKRVHREDFDIDRAAKLEVNWWIVHRRLFANPENQDLVDALVDLYVEADGLERNAVRLAAEHRARGMYYSDVWVNQGRPANSPLLEQEEQAYYNAYIALKQAIAD